jgi:pimeloyl-ACP methyl ester carboxylesterase
MSFFSRERFSRDEAVAALGAPGETTVVGGRKVHHVTRGAGPHVVLVHGFFYHSCMWREALDALAPAFTCHAIDLFGFGWSDRPSAPDEATYGYDLWADQIAGFLDAKRIDRAHLVGQSLGAGAILRFAARAPDRVGRVALVAPAGLPNPLEKGRTALAWPVLGEIAAHLPGLGFAKKVLRDYFIFDPEFVTDAYAAEVARPSEIHGSVAAALWILRNVELGGIEAAVRAFGEARKPTMLVWGREDRAIPVENAARFAELVDVERRVIVERAGHVPHQERADVVIPAIRDFLEIEPTVRRERGPLEEPAAVPAAAASAEPPSERTARTIVREAKAAREALRAKPRADE